MSLTYNFNKDWYLACVQFADRLRIDFIMVLNVPEIPPKVAGIVTLSKGQRGGPGKTTLSLFKDVTIRLGRAGVKDKSDDVTLYDVVFFSTASLLIT